MRKEKITITLDHRSIGELTNWSENVFPSRGQAIQEAIGEKLQRMKKTCLAKECSKLDPAFERRTSEEGITVDVKEWPEYKR